MKMLYPKHFLIKPLVLTIGMSVPFTFSLLAEEKIVASDNAHHTVAVETMIKQKNEKIGEKLPDGTILAGYIRDSFFNTELGDLYADNLITTQADAPGLYTWTDGQSYCVNLVENGYDDWHLPNDTELKILFKNRAKLSGFKENASDYYDIQTRRSYMPTHYWAAVSNPNNRNVGWLHSFNNGNAGWNWEYDHASVRCVRPEPSQ